MKDLLKELQHAILTNDRMCQEEIFCILADKGIDRESAKIKAFNEHIE